MQRLRACVLALIPLVLNAQTEPLPSDWRAVQSIPADSPVKVRLRNGRTVKGKLADLSDDGLAVSKRAERVDLARQDIVQVYRGGRASMVKPTAVGAAIGGGIGLTLGAVAYSRGDFIKGVIPGMGAIGAGAGALVGMVSSLGTKYALIYTARPAPGTP